MEQIQLHLALVKGEKVVDRPEDLYIPPEALEVFLESFEGPLDFLLYLIKKQKFDILDLPIIDITRQYMEYVELMREINLELAGEYLVMAAMLAEIKSRMLLPVNKDAMEESEDPRAELIRQLLEYEKFKRAANSLDELPRFDREYFTGKGDINPDCKAKVIPPEVDLKDLVMALNDALRKATNFQAHEIKREHLSTRERMTSILDKLKDCDSYLPFQSFFTASESRAGVVVTFLAILELVKEKFLILTQNEEFGAIHVKRNIELSEEIERVS